MVGSLILAARIIRLGPGECPDEVTGARYFAALAFPERGEDAARQDAAAAYVANYLHEANRVDESDAPFEDDRLNNFVQLDPKWCRAKLRTAHRRLSDRSELARAVRPWIRELLGEPHGPVPGIKKFTQRQIALYLCGEDAGHGDLVERADNFQKRVWRPGRPVMHLAIAYDLLLCAVGGEQTKFDLNLASVNVIGELAGRARQVAELIVTDPRFGVSADDLLHLEWVA